MNAAVNIGVEDMSATIVRYGLYIGALFQIVCILAAVVLPESPDEDPNLDGSKDNSDDDSSEENSPEHTPRKPPQHQRNRKQDKKKRR